MSSETPIPKLAEKVADLAQATMGEIQPSLVQAALIGSRAENENLRRRDNFYVVPLPGVGGWVGGSAVNSDGADR